jgi:hypothetical protein
MKKLLLLLQWQKGQQHAHWVLKSPHHMEWLDVLLRVYPGAHIIHTHRDPLRNLASFLSMAYHAMRIFSAAVTPEEVGAFWTRKITRLVERAMAFRKAGAAHRISDVIYYDLVKEPMQAVGRIYGNASLSFTEEAKRSMQEQRERSRQHQYGVHHYRLEDFGVDQASAEAGFAQYRARFNLPHEDGPHGQ